MKKIIIALIIPMFLSCVTSNKDDILVGGFSGSGYFVHGDTLETYNAPNSCMKFIDSDLPQFEKKKSIQETYPFLASKDSLFSDYMGMNKAHYYSIGKTSILIADCAASSIVYANIFDSRIKLQQGIHIGMSLNDVMKKIGLPAVDREIHHIIFFSRGVIEGLLTFDFQNDVLSRVEIRSSSDNKITLNPAPYFEFLGPELTRFERGEKIYARGENSSCEWQKPVCFLNAKGDTVISLSRGYRSAGWDEIGWMGLVLPKHGKNFIALNNKGKELFRVLALFDGSPDFIGEGMFRIIEGPESKVGYADTLGNVIIKPQFAYGTPFRYGRAKVTMTGSWDEGNPEMPEWKSNDWFFIDRTGRRIDYSEDSTDKK